MAGHLNMTIKDAQLDKQVKVLEDQNRQTIQAAHSKSRIEH